MRWKSLLVFLIAITIINVSAISDAISISSLNIAPDFLLIFLVFFAINCDRNDAIIVSFAIGFAADIFSPAMMMGPCAISYGLIGGLISLFRKQVVMKRFIYQSMTIFFTAAIAGSLAELLVSVKSAAIDVNTYPSILLTALYTALIGPVIWMLLDRPLTLFFVERPNLE